jgi:hypothetical protein
MEYSFGQKNHWRRTIWNEILRRTKGREQREIILYLAGPDDLDRKVATSKGVPNHNLIAVETNKKTINILRSKGVNVIEGNIHDILCAWPYLNQKHCICAINADFCCGMEEKTLDLYPCLGHATLAINFQRGRDPYSNNIRSLHNHGDYQLYDIETGIYYKDDKYVSNLKTIFWQTICSYHMETLNSYNENYDKLKKHRGLQYASYSLNRLYRELVWSKHKLGEKVFMEDISCELFNSLMTSKPRFYSYKSTKGVYMDSMVANTLHVHELLSWKKPTSDSFPFPKWIDDNHYARVKKSQRKVSAALAIRTQRINKDT